MSKRSEQYKENKAAKVGAELTCPVCGSSFVKKQWQQAFCCSHCKDTYWNAKGDRHKDPNYQRKYNQKHPERYERLLSLGFTAAEREHNRALYELATNPDFRDYVNDPSWDGSWDEHACIVSLEDQLDAYEGNYGDDPDFDREW